MFWAKDSTEPVHHSRVRLLACMASLGFFGALCRTVDRDTLQSPGPPCALLFYIIFFLQRNRLPQAGPFNVLSNFEIGMSCRCLHSCQSAG